MLVDGVDVREYDLKYLRENIGMVLQKNMLFSGTIAENLRWGNENATDQELWDALRVAQAEAFVSALPLKLDAPVAQGGTNFSGGQRQRLAIARALVKKAKLYIFDDSFSALDFKTDARLRAALKAEVTNSAVIIVAQRISTILDADQIIVLDEGRIVGKGTHRELMNHCPIYRQIANSQLSQEELA